MKVVDVRPVKEDVRGLAFLVMQCGREFRNDIAVGLSDYKIVEAPWKVVLKSLGESFTWVFCGAEANAGLSTSLCEGLLVVSGQAATASIVQCRFLVVPGGRRHFTELCWGAVASEGFVFLNKIPPMTVPAIPPKTRTGLPEKISLMSMIIWVGPGKGAPLSIC